MVYLKIKKINIVIFKVVIINDKDFFIEQMNNHKQ